MNKIIKVLIVIMLSLCSTGCWNYVGLNEMTMVTGFAIDKGKGDNKYHISFEIVDLAEVGKERKIVPKLVEADGVTIFDAARNAKRRINNKLYFGNTQIIVVSEKIAKEGIGDVIDWFLRDAEPRETISLVISQEKTAKEMIGKKGVGITLSSIEIKDIVEKDQRVTSSTMNMELYQVMATLKKDGKSLVLPAFHRIKNDDEYVNEANGIAIFKKDRLIGYLSPEDTKFYLLTINEMKGGVISLEKKDKESNHNISFEVFKSNTSLSYTYKDNQIQMIVKPYLKVSIDEDDRSYRAFSEDEINTITKELKRKIIKDIKRVVKSIQDKFNSDIFGFGEKIHQQNPKLWKKLVNDWDKLYKTIDVKVIPNVTIVNTAYVK